MRKVGILEKRTTMWPAIEPETYR